MKMRIVTVAALTVAVTGLAGCGSSSGDNSSSGGSTSGTTITYWASNQAATVQDDYKQLQPLLDKFKQQTGTTVKLQVIGWPDLQNKILAAIASGNGPDVLNIGNTWAPSLQASGAFLPFDAANMKAIGGADKFVSASLATGGVKGQDPTSVPLYSLVYGLYYNKKMFADAGLQPPTTWEELVSDAKKLTDKSKGVYGMAMEGGSYTEGVHFAYIFGQQQGADPFDSSGKPTFTSQGMIDGVKQYVSLMSEGVVNPSSAQYKNGPEAPGDFAKGNAAMLMSQNNADNTLVADGMKTSEYGVVAIPAATGAPKDTASFVAGINLSIFKNSKHTAADLQFVKFMTSQSTQQTLDVPFAALPVLKGVTPNFTTNPAEASTFQEILNTKAVPLPLVPNEAAYETNVGNAVVQLTAQAATGHAPTDADIKAALQKAQDSMAAAG